jgi:hypothetical protein
MGAVPCRDWSSFLSNFLGASSGVFAGVPKVARNAINLQLIADPLSPFVRPVVPDVLQLYLQQMPVRVGVLFIVPNDTGSDSQLGTEAESASLTGQGLFVRCESCHAIFAFHWLHAAAVGVVLVVRSVLMSTGFVMFQAPSSHLNRIMIVQP